MLANMEWYRTFYFAAKWGSLSKAAEELYITQPAVSHAIKQLESRLGGQLFFRTPRGVKLTAEGEVLFKYIEQAYHFITTGESKIAEMQQFTSGEIRIGAGDTLCKHYLLPFLSSFHAAYPEIKIQVTNRTSRKTAELLKQGKIDFGIVNLPLNDKQLRIRESIEIHDCFVVGGAYKELADKPIGWAELSSYPIIMLERGCNSRAFIDHFAESQGAVLRPEIELGSLDLLLQFAQAGLGVACIIRDFARDELEQGKVVELLLKNPPPPRKIGLITLNDVPVSTAARRLLDMLS